MKIIVTGGAGFLGSHLCDKLIELGHEVICIDNLSRGSKENIKHLQKNKKFKFLKLDVVKKIPTHLKADQIYHLASIASPHPFRPKTIHVFPFETMLVNTVGTWNLCEHALKNNAKFLFASTSEVYGDPQETPQKESYRGNVSTIGPRSVYDEAKRFGETITSAYVRNKGLNGVIVRIFNTYGERMAQDDGRVVIEFVTASLKNNPIAVFGDGKQIRSFCYVSDMTDGIIQAMEKGQKGRVYNLGNPDEITILELARIIKKLTNTSSEIEFQPLPKDDPQKRCPDISKAKAQLGWEPKIDLDKGLKRLIAALRLYLL